MRGRRFNPRLVPCAEQAAGPREQMSARPAAKPARRIATARLGNRTAASKPASRHRGTKSIGGNDASRGLCRREGLPALCGGTVALPRSAVLRGTRHVALPIAIHRGHGHEAQTAGKRERTANRHQGLQGISHSVSRRHLRSGACRASTSSLSAISGTSADITDT